MSNLRGLYVNWSGIKDLSSLRKLTRLRCLHLGSSTQVTSIDVLAELRGLFWLELENLRGIHDFSPLAALTQLVGLSLEGSAWRTQIVDSLEPIGRLKELRYLSLSNLRAKDRNLAPLIHLKKLRRLCLAPWWNKQDLAALKRSLPELLDP
jgi:Leucine-rich repeat (LRR) protein